MSLAVAYARAQLGLAAPLVVIETHLTPGLPAFNMVGLAEAAVRESRERVRSAILNAGFEFPGRRITINLAPADLPKEGTRFDLAIALSILAASGQIRADALPASEYLAELALTGALRPIKGILAAALAAHGAGRAIFCASGNAQEISLCEDLLAHAPTSLREVCDHLEGRTLLAPIPHTSPVATGTANLPDLAEVRGQFPARRALEIAAAGGHNLLMVGPPGTGKTMLAMRLPSLLPPLSPAAALEAAVVRSVNGSLAGSTDWRLPPFRSPHHTASAAALIGGGSVPRPGEVSLAHLGVLFLDELPEFSRHVLEVLREPLESRCVTISRASRQATFPADFQLVAAMNPCPCGYAGDPSGRCQCSPVRIARYLERVSGPLLDRIDIQVEVPRETDWLQHGQDEQLESSAMVSVRVAEARRRQLARQGCLNARLGASGIGTHIPLGREAAALLEQAFARFRISPRVCHRLLRMARTIADLAGVEQVGSGDVAEALGLRRMDRQQAERQMLYGG